MRRAALICALHRIMSRCGSFCQWDASLLRQTTQHAGLRGAYRYATVALPSCMTSLPLLGPPSELLDRVIQSSSNVSYSFPLVRNPHFLFCVCSEANAGRPFCDSSCRMGRPNGSDAAIIVMAVSEADHIRRPADEKVKSVDRAAPTRKYDLTMPETPALENKEVSPALGPASLPCNLSGRNKALTRCPS